ncbi:hypothetical protein ACXJY6_04520 [Vibrio sp. RC27]
MRCICRGDPELYLDELSNNSDLKNQIRAYIEAGKPALAECGGMMYLGTSLTNIDGECRDMCNVLNQHASMQSRLAELGLVEATL